MKTAITHIKNEPFSKMYYYIYIIRVIYIYIYIIMIITELDRTNWH